MAKEIPWFKFEVSEWAFGRIQKQPEDVQGMFINLCCKYWHKLGDYSKEDALLDFGPRINNLIDAKIIVINNVDKLCIKFLDQQLDERAQDSAKQRQKGLKSAELRATRVQQQSTAVEPSPTEEKRREEKREEERIQSLGDSKNNSFLIINPPYVNSIKYRLHGVDGVTEFLQQSNGDWPQIATDDKKKKFVRNNDKKEFRDYSHLLNSIHLFLNQNGQS